MMGLFEILIKNVNSLVSKTKYIVRKPFMNQNKQSCSIVALPLWGCRSLGAKPWIYQL